MATCWKGRQLPAGVAFVGSHPHSRFRKNRRAGISPITNLFDGRFTVVTRTPRTDSAALAKIVAFWQAVGARVTIMAPADHDRALADQISAALRLPPPPCRLPGEVFELTATGFRDTTRVAGGDPGIWTAIFSHNAAAAALTLMPFSDRTSRFQAADPGDWWTVETLLTQAKKVRDALGS